MKEMSSKERFIKTIKGEIPDKIPFCDYMDEQMEMQLRQYYGFRKEGYDFWKFIGVDAVEFCEYYAPLFTGDPKTKKLATQAKLQSDGSSKAFVEEGLIADWDDLKLMEFPDLKAPGYYDFADKYIEQCNKYDMASCFALRSFPVFCTIYTMGFENFSYALIDDVELIQEVIKRYNDWNISLIHDLEKRGMDSIIVCNDMAFNSGIFLAPDKFREIFLPAMKEVTDNITVPFAFHSDGNLYSIMDDLLELTPCINPIDPNCMDIYEVKDKYKSKIVPWGNLDVNLLANGSKEQVKHTTIKLLSEVGKDRRYIFGSGNSIPFYSKLENVITMIETYKNYVGK